MHREFAEFRYAGVNDIHVMSAAYNEWNLKGYSLEKGKVNAPTAGTDITSIGNPDLIDTQEEAVKLLNDSGAQLVDTRTVEEFAGTDSGYSYHDIAGKIDGTINSPSGIGYSSGMYFYRNPDKTMRSGDLIEACGKSRESIQANTCRSSAAPAGEQLRRHGMPG